MSKPIFDPLEALLVAPATRKSDLPVADRRPADVDRRPADVEMVRVLGTKPLRTA
jgi:hypothetical protein